MKHVNSPPTLPMSSFFCRTPIIPKGSHPLEVYNVKRSRPLGLRVRERKPFPSPHTPSIP